MYCCLYYIQSLHDSRTYFIRSTLALSARVSDVERARVHLRAAGGRDVAAQRVAEPRLGASDLVEGGCGVALHDLLADVAGVVHDEGQLLAAADRAVLGAVDAVAGGAT